MVNRQNLGLVFRWPKKVLFFMVFGGAHGVMAVIWVVGNSNIFGNFHPEDWGR